MHEDKVRCASVHLFLGVHSKCLHDISHRKHNEFVYFLLFLSLKGPVPNKMHVSGAIFTSLLLF